MNICNRLRPRRGSEFDDEPMEKGELMSEEEEEEEE
jgi:hypothetical protein